MHLIVCPVCFQRSEYIFTLMEPNIVKESGVGEKKQEKNKERLPPGEREASRVKSAERGRLLLGLRLSKERLHFLFRSHGGVIEKWKFQGTRLADNQWHTLILAVGSHRVGLTVDCSSPLEM